MPSDQATDRFVVICLKCQQQMLARREWIGKDVRCPHCATPMRVPGPPPHGGPVRGLPSGLPRVQSRLNFPCPRCASLLESTTDKSGDTARCPTCGARFVVPDASPRTGLPLPAQLLDSDDQDPIPMHAYAASGQQAPRLHRLPDGRFEIECPRCHARAGVDVNNCTSCGVPFTIDGVPTLHAYRGQSLATVSLILGLVAMPLFFMVLPGVLAIGFGVASWAHRGQSWPSGLATTGIVLGVVSVGAAVLVYI